MNANGYCGNLLWQRGLTLVPLLLAAILAAFRKWRSAAYAFALFAAVWFTMSGGYLWYWK